MGRPCSGITKLVIEFDGCMLGIIDLRALPRLERLACMGAPLDLRFGSMPRLARLNLTYDEDANAKTPAFVLFDVRNLHFLSGFLSRLPDLEALVLPFTGPEMWIRPPLDMPPLGKLRRLLLADMPSSWDITWTRLLLEAAPSLETMHIHVAAVVGGGAPAGPQFAWPPSSEFKYRRLREVVVSGFEGTPRQVWFVRFLRCACTALRSIVLLRHGRVRDMGLWDWEMASSSQREWQWSEEERGTMLRKIEDGASDSATACPTDQIVFG